MVDIKVEVFFLTKRWWVFNCPPWSWDWRLLRSPHINEKYMDIKYTKLGPTQTPLHTCAEPNWWIKYGKRVASESIWYGSFNLVQQKRQTRPSLSHYSTWERQVIHTALLTLNLYFFPQSSSFSRSCDAQNRKLREVEGKEEYKIYLFTMPGIILYASFCLREWWNCQGLESGKFSRILWAMFPRSYGRAPKGRMKEFKWIR